MAIMKFIINPGEKETATQNFKCIPARITINKIPENVRGLIISLAYADGRSIKKPVYLRRPYMNFTLPLTEKYAIISLEYLFVDKETEIELIID